MNKHTVLAIAFLFWCCCIHQSYALKTHLDECHHTTFNVIKDLEMLQNEGKVTFFDLQANLRKLETVCFRYIYSVDLTQIGMISQQLDFFKPQALMSITSFQNIIKNILKK